MQRSYAQQQRVAVNAEGRFLAHWDEFVEHRKEVQAKLEEAFEMASDRREAGLRLTRLCQQLETKVDRLARQSKEQLSKGEAVEDRLSSQAKNVDACKEAIEVLRDKIHRQVQDLTGSLSSAKTELSEEVERHYQALQEAMRRGDRCIAEEFFRKLQESSEKLSGNMQVLEDALATFVRQSRVQLAELTEQMQANKDLSNKLVESNQKEVVAQITSLQEELGKLTERADTSEGTSLEQVRQLQSVEAKLTKLQDSFVRFEGKTSAAEEAEKQRASQVQEQMREVKDQSATAVSRAKEELLESIKTASSATKEESIEALRAVESSMSADLQVLREELRKTFTSSSTRQQLLVDELRGEIGDTLEQSRSNGRELLALIEELQGQVAEVRSENRRSLEEVASRVRAESQANVEDLKAQLRTLRLELGEARKDTKTVNEELQSALEENCTSLRRALADTSSLTAKAQATADEATAECARLQSFVEAGLVELRRDVQRGAQQVVALDRQMNDCKDDLSQVAKTHAAHQRETSELSRRLDEMEKSNEDIANKGREQVRDASRSFSDRISEVEERLLRTAEQHDVSLLSVKNELVRVAGAAQDMAPEVEQACRRLIGEEAQLQAEKWASSFESHKQAAADALSNALAEPRSELKALRKTFAEQEAAVTARLERLVGDMQRQDRAASSRLKHEIQELTVSCEERVTAASATFRQALQEQRQEVFRQLEPMRETLSEVSASMQATRRTEAELGSHFERLLVTTEELCAGQEALSAQGADTAQSLNDLKSEIRNVGTSQDLNVKQLASPRMWRRSHDRLDLSDGARGSGIEPLLRSPEEPMEARAASLGMRSLHSSPEQPRAVQPSDSSAFSRLGELRRRLAPAQHEAEPITGVPARSAAALVAQGRLASSI